MKKITGSMIIILFLIIVTGCSVKKSDAPEKSVGGATDKELNNSSDNSTASKGPVNSSREDCMSGCITLWKTNEGNMKRSESDMMNDCNSLCDAGQGIQKQDVASCAKAEGILRDSCYSDIAKNSNNPELCEKIEGGMLNSACYVAIVEKTGDKSLCEKITVKMMKDLCLDGGK